MFLLVLEKKIHEGLLESDHGISFLFPPEGIITFDIVYTSLSALL